MEFFTYRIADVFDRFSSGKNITEEKISDSGQYPVYGGNGLRGYTNTSNFNGECILIGRQGAKCGNVRYFNGEGYMTDHAIVGVCKSNHNTQFMNYALASLNLNRLSGQAAQPGLSVGMLKKQKILLPSLENQTKIANIIFGYNNVIENNNKRIKLLEQMAETLYKEWFVNYRFVGHENTLFENNVPVGWEKVTLDSILSKIATGLNPRKNFVLGEGDNYYVTIKNMGDNNIYLDDKCDKVTDEAIRKINNRSDLRRGDLLFSGIGTIGRVYLINIPTDNWNISESVFTMRPNEKVSSEYLYLLLLSNDVQNYCQSNANGAAQKGIRMADLKKYAFWLAPKPILDEFTNIVKPIIEQVNLIRKSNINLIKQRDLLLPRLMSGKLEV